MTDLRWNWFQRLYMEGCKQYACTAVSYHFASTYPDFLQTTICTVWDYLEVEMSDAKHGNDSSMVIYQTFWANRAVMFSSRQYAFTQSRLGCKKGVFARKPKKSTLKISFQNIVEKDFFVERNVRRKVQRISSQSFFEELSFFPAIFIRSNGKLNEALKHSHDYSPWLKWNQKTKLLFFCILKPIYQQLTMKSWNNRWFYPGFFHVIIWNL